MGNVTIKSYQIMKLVILQSSIDENVSKYVYFPESCLTKLFKNTNVQERVEK